MINNSSNNCPICGNDLLIVGIKEVCQNSHFDAVKDSYVYINFNKNTFIHIYCGAKIIQIIICDSDKANHQAEIYDIPYFEPDFSNYADLLKKIKLYLAFS